MKSMQKNDGPPQHRPFLVPGIGEDLSEKFSVTGKRPFRRCWRFIKHSLGDVKMAVTKSSHSMNGDGTRREIEARITEAEEEIKLALSVLSDNNVRASSSLIDHVEIEHDRFRQNTRARCGCHLEAYHSICDVGRPISSKSGLSALDEKQLSGGNGVQSSAERTSTRSNNWHKRVTQRRQLTSVKNTPPDYPHWPRAPVCIGPRLIHSMHELNATSKIEEGNVIKSSVSSSPAACSTLSISGKAPGQERTSRLHPPMNGQSAESGIGASPAHTVSYPKLYKGAKHGPTASTTTNSLSYSDFSSYELLDLTNSDSVNRWASQIMAELDSIADSSSALNDEKECERDASAVPADAEKKFEEACMQLRELDTVSRSSKGILIRNATKMSANSGDVTNWAANGSNATAWKDEREQMVRAEEDKLTTPASTDVVGRTKAGKSASQPVEEKLRYSTEAQRADSDPIQGTNICPFDTGNRRAGSCGRFYPAGISTNGNNSRVTTNNATGMELPYRIGSYGSHRNGNQSGCDARREMHSGSCIPACRAKGLVNSGYDNSRPEDEQEFINAESSRRGTTVFQTRLQSVDENTNCDTDQLRPSGPTKTVRGVVESLIRQAETHLGSKTTAANNNITNSDGIIWRRQSAPWNESRLDAMENQLLWFRSSASGDYVELNDACTQTTPLSLSRSSSFTWFSDADQQKAASDMESRAFGPGDVTGTDTSVDEDDNSSSITPMTECADPNATMAISEDNELAFNNSLSLSALSHSESSCNELDKSTEKAHPNYGHVRSSDATASIDNPQRSVLTQGNDLIDRGYYGIGEKKQKVEACETWPPATGAPPSEPLTESLRMLLESLNSPIHKETGNQLQRMDKSVQPSLGARSLSIAADATRMIPSQQQQRIQRTNWPAETCAYKSTPFFPSQQHFHLPSELRKCIGAVRNPPGNESDYEGSIYDNVPNCAKRASTDQFGYGKEKDDGVSQFLRINNRQTVDTPESPSDNSAAVNMQRDTSVASGLLADSESSPVCAEKGFALLDGLRSDVATPDSVRSLTSSDGGAANASCTQAAPEFQYKSARDYMMDREEQIRTTSFSRLPHRCPPTTTETTSIGFVPKQSVLRGETTRLAPSCNDQPTNASIVRQESNENRTQFSKDIITRQAKSMLANSLPALDRLLDSVSFTNGGRLKTMTAAANNALQTGQLNGTNSKQLVEDCETAKQCGAVFSSRKENAEAEARQCCFWLRAAGFPQYVSMYEDGLFPIDVEAVNKDHEFLDADSLQALFRRLRTLNRCALMKLGNGMAKTDATPPAAKFQAEKDSDDDDDIALSRRWRFVRKSRTWSRIVDEFGGCAGQYQLTPPDSSLSPTRVAKNVDDAEMITTAAQSTETGPKTLDEQRRVSIPAASGNHRNASLCQRECEYKEPNNTEPQQQRLRRSQSERLRDKAKAFVRRMEMKSSKLRRRSPSLRRNGQEPEISNPVLIQHYSASPAHMKMLKESTERLEAPYASSDAIRPNGAAAAAQQPFGKRTTSGDERRRGRVFADETNEQVCIHPLNGVVRDAKLATDGQRDCGVDGAKLQPGCSAVSLAHGRQQRLQFSHDRNQRRKMADSDSSPETQTKNGSSSLRVQVDVELRANTLPPVSHSSFDSSDADHSPQCWERRDSGVGSSLSRSPSAPSGPRVRWHSFQKRAGPCAAYIRSGNAPISVDHLTAAQIIAIQKYALLKLTALMEKYSPSYKSSGWSWGVQKLLRRMKASETKVYKDRQVFGVPLAVVAQRTGQPLPQCVLHAMRYLRKQAVDNVGLFRKSGVRSRIQKLRQLCETSTDLPQFDTQQAYDVADMVKQYFRELPEPLLTTKLSETFVAIHLHVPEHLRMEAMQKTVLLLPDENREVLLSLLYFLRDVASHADQNQMSIQNLSVCFAPTLFQLSSRNAAMSPTRRHKTITTPTGLPSEAELMENRAAQVCLASMIANCTKLFSVPQDILMKCAHTVTDFHEPSTLTELGSPYGNYNAYLTGCVDALMKEHRERWRGWVTEGCNDGVEITSKKANDEYPLKLWRCWVDVEAPPRELLHRILRERDAWDDDIIKWRVVRKLADNCEVFQYVVNDMPPHPTRDYCVVRLWLSDVQELRGGCVLVQTSVSCQDAQMLGGVRGVCLASRYIIEPSGGGKSRITQVDRVDMRGRSRSWYNKAFGYVIASQLARLRDSFKQMAEGPETKV